ncbi:MAG: hypothetical protein WD070_01405 [Pirellulaceae bacterium]
MLTALMLVGGFVVLTLGAELLVRSASALAVAARISPLVIGLTVVAYGTSTPELVVSVQSSLRGQAEIALGNVVGSNIFNLMGVLGLSGVVSGQGVAVSEAALQLDIPVMIAVAVACLPIFFTGNVIARWEGGLFFAYYCVYTAYLMMAAISGNITRTFEVMMLGFVLPLTAITLAVTVVRAWRTPAEKPA